MVQYFRNISNSVLSILEGMAVTLSWMFRRPYTVQWPDKIEKHVEDALPERYRGILEVDTRLCIGCMMCMKECPIGCIAVAVEKDAETKERRITQFDIDASKCMVCGLCVEACPTGGLRHTSQFAAADGDIRNLVLRYIEKGSPVAPRSPKEPAPEPRPKGSIVSAKIKNGFSMRPAGKMRGER
jgi:NADH-quinone oxidoreductase subunit I